MIKNSTEILGICLTELQYMVHYSMRKIYFAMILFFFLPSNHFYKTQKKREGGNNSKYKAEDCTGAKHHYPK